MSIVLNVSYCPSHQLKVDTLKVVVLWPVLLQARKKEKRRFCCSTHPGSGTSASTHSLSSTAMQKPLGTDTFPGWLATEAIKNHHRGNTFLTSLPMVSGHHHRYVTRSNSSQYLISIASFVSFVRNLGYVTHIVQTYPKYRILV